MKTTSGVYAICNTVNGSKYIGGSRNIERRLRAHQYKLRDGAHWNAKLQSDWNVLGASSFQFIILEETALVEEREKFYIKTCQAPYNSIIVSSDKRWIDSPETRMKKSKPKPPFTEEHRRNIGLAHKGKKQSPETIARRKLAMLGKKFPGRKSPTRETIEKRAAKIRGRKRSVESRMKMSQAMRGNQNGLGHTITDAHKLKLAEGRRKARLAKMTKS